MRVCVGSKWHEDGTVGNKDLEVRRYKCVKEEKSKAQ